MARQLLHRINVNSPSPHSKIVFAKPALIASATTGVKQAQASLPGAASRGLPPAVCGYVGENGAPSFVNGLGPSWRASSFPPPPFMCALSQHRRD